jgi:hypothetical protein
MVLLEQVLLRRLHSSVLEDIMLEMCGICQQMGIPSFADSSKFSHLYLSMSSIAP